MGEARTCELMAQLAEEWKGPQVSLSEAQGTGEGPVRQIEKTPDPATSEEEEATPSAEKLKMVEWETNYRIVASPGGISRPHRTGSCSCWMGRTQDSAPTDPVSCIPPPALHLPLPATSTAPATPPPICTGQAIGHGSTAMTTGASKHQVDCQTRSGSSDTTIQHKVRVTALAHGGLKGRDSQQCIGSELRHPSMCEMRAASRPIKGHTIANDLSAPRVVHRHVDVHGALLLAAMPCLANRTLRRNLQRAQPSARPGLLSGGSHNKPKVREGGTRFARRCRKAAVASSRGDQRHAATQSLASERGPVDLVKSKRRASAATLRAVVLTRIHDIWLVSRGLARCWHEYLSAAAGSRGECRCQRPATRRTSLSKIGNVGLSSCGADLLTSRSAQHSSVILGKICWSTVHTWILLGANITANNPRCNDYHVLVELLPNFCTQFFARPRTSIGLPASTAKTYHHPRLAAAHIAEPAAAWLRFDVLGNPSGCRPKRCA